MNRALVETIKERISIVDIVSRYIKLIPAGAQMKGLCPFHGEKTPSLYVSPVRGSWKCFGCGKGGDVLSFVQEIERVSFPEAIETLANQAGIPIEKGGWNKDTGVSDERTSIYQIASRAATLYHSLLAASAPARSYLESRGVSGESIKKYMIGYAPDAWDTLAKEVRPIASLEEMISSGMFLQGKQHAYDRFRARIMFPTRDVRDRVITFSGRIWSETGEYVSERPDAGKYINGPETAVYKKSKVLYGLSEARIAITQKKRAILVEGHLDCVMSSQIGYTETIALAGTALTDEHTELLSRFCDEVILCLDADSAGQKAVSRSVVVLYKAGFFVRVATLSPGMDPAECIRTNKSAYCDAIDNATDYVSARIGQLRSHKVDIRQAEKILKDEIYPILAYQGNPIYKDRDISVIASYLNVDPTTIREHIQKYSSEEVKQQNRVMKDESGIPVVSPLDRLAAAWAKLVDDPGTSDSIRQYIHLATGNVYSDLQDFLLKESREDQDYHLAYTAWYGDHPPNRVITESLRQYCIFVLAERKKQLFMQPSLAESQLAEQLKQLLDYEHYIESQPYVYQT
jgi:DNA primase